MRGERWLRATPRQPCSICGRPDWCQTSPDGAIVKCMRVVSGSFQTVTDGTGEGYLHRLAECPTRGSLQPRRELPPMLPPIAAPGLTDAVYSRVLDALTLSPDHVADLLRRGLDEQAIVRNGYGTCASADVMSKIVSEAMQRFNVQEGAPGLRSDRDGWTILADSGDLLIPIRDHCWRIVALIRRTNDETKRYRWVSDGNPSCGTPPHNAEPWNAEFRRAIYVTEGALKADVIASQLGFTTVGLAGCGSIPAGFAAALRDAYPSVRVAFIAFDADAETNPNVRRGRDRLTQAMLAAGYHVNLVKWDSHAGKGLDDVLASAGTGLAKKFEQTKRNQCRGNRYDKPSDQARQGARAEDPGRA
jgi:hypothetical protein